VCFFLFSYFFFLLLILFLWNIFFLFFGEGRGEGRVKMEVGFVCGSYGWGGIGLIRYDGGRRNPIGAACCIGGGSGAWNVPSSSSSGGGGEYHENEQLQAGCHRAIRGFLNRRALRTVRYYMKEFHDGEKQTKYSCLTTVGDEGSEIGGGSARMDMSV